MNEPKRQIDFIYLHPQDSGNSVEAKVLEEAVASDHSTHFCGGRVKVKVFTWFKRERSMFSSFNKTFCGYLEMGKNMGAVSRRSWMQSVAATSLGAWTASASGLVLPKAFGSESTDSLPMQLYKSLSDDQRRKSAYPKIILAEGT